jgi:hypothetical protein
MVIWVIVLVGVVLLLILGGVALGVGSRAARRRGLDQASAAQVKVVERKP